MAGSPTPCIAAIGVIGKHDNPLHIAVFPPHSHTRGQDIEFQFLLNSSLDVFHIRSKDKTRLDQDFGLLFAVDHRLSVWGWETGTGTRFAIILDMWGREAVMGKEAGIKEGELKSAFKALQNAYVGLLQNPFHIPDDHRPPAMMSGRNISGKITSKKFTAEVHRIGMNWKPGMSVV